MKVIFDEKGFQEVMETARRCRMEQLEKEFLSNPGYQEGFEAKERLMQRMEDLVPTRVKELLRDHDDVYAALVYRAQEYYYGQGFLDGLNLFKWMEFIDGKSKGVMEMLAEKNKDIKKAYNLLRIISKDEKARMAYEARQAEITDQMTREKVALGRGREEGKVEGKIEGKIEGKVEDILELLEELGSIPESLAKLIRSQTSLEILGKWFKQAARAESLAEFEAKIGLE